MPGKDNAAPDEVALRDASSRTCCRVRMPWAGSTSYSAPRAQMGRSRKCALRPVPPPRSFFQSATEGLADLVKRRLRTGHVLDAIQQHEVMNGAVIAGRGHVDAGFFKLAGISLPLVA